MSTMNQPRSHEDTKVLEPELRFSEFNGEWLKSNVPIKIVAGNAYPMSSYGESGSMLVQGQNIFPNELKVDTPIFIPDSKLSERDVQIKKNDILLGLNRPVIGNRLKACLYRDDRKAVLYQRAGKLVFDESKLLSGFLFQYLFSGVFTRQLLGELVGSDQPYIKSDLFKVTKNNFPDFQEQQKIADFLSSVDKKIEQLTQKHRLLTEYKKGVMQQIFSQQIRFKDNQGYDYPKWHQTKFSNLFKFIKTNSLSRADLVNDGEVMNIHYGDIHTRLPSQTRIETAALPYIAPHIDLSKFEDDTFCRDGDLIVADASEDYLDIGKAIELSAIENNKVIAGLHTFLARPYKSKVVNGFSGYVMQIDPVRKQIMRLATGVSVLGISKTNLGKVILPIPCIDEQQKIANFLTEIDQKIDQAWSILEQTKAFKKGLLQKMFV